MTSQPGDVTVRETWLRSRMETGITSIYIGSESSHTIFLDPRSFHFPPPLAPTQIFPNPKIGANAEIDMIYNFFPSPSRILNFASSEKWSLGGSRWPSNTFRFDLKRDLRKLRTLLFPSFSLPSTCKIPRWKKGGWPRNFIRFLFSNDLNKHKTKVRFSQD